MTIPATTIPFVKMHGLGNDFVVIDARERPVKIGAAATRALADRRRGIGFDQLLIIEKATDGGAAFMRIRNADGGEVAACGNGTRAVAALLLAESGAREVAIETAAGVLACRGGPDGLITVDMGPARTGWRDIPLAESCDTLHLPLALDGLADPVAVGMGNPHAVFFVEDAERVDLERLGPPLERHPLFPEGANIEVAHRLGPDRLRMRVWERGAGITQACGSGACAVAVAAHRRGLTGRRVEIVLDGGALQVEWRADGHVLLTGPVATSFTGTIAVPS